MMTGAGWPRAAVSGASVASVRASPGVRALWPGDRAGRILRFRADSYRLETGTGRLTEQVVRFSLLPDRAALGSHDPDG